MADESFNADEPVAFFLTWTTYGTWLPGDDRGSWHDGVFATSNELFRGMAESAMKESVFFASHDDRDIVEDTIGKHCDIRGWVLHAVSARSNHVHVVVTARGYKPETARDQFKAWCTRKLKSRFKNRERFWTEGGSCRCINSEDELARVIEYVLNAQDRKGSEDAYVDRPIQARRASE